MKRLAPALIAFAAAVLLGANAIGDPSTPAAPAKHAGSCFWVNDVDSFASNDDSVVYLRVGVNDVYKATLFAPCRDVSWDHNLAIRSQVSSSICEGTNPGAEVISHTAIGPNSCPVNEIRKLTPAEVAALPKDARP